MDKSIGHSAHIGDAGIAVVHRRASELGWVWHARPNDAGIDGSIEVRNPATGEMTNRHLFVQSKASNGRFPGESERTFYFNCDSRDVDYWMKADCPVLLICSHPETQEAWWAHVQGWFSDPARRASGRIDFDKATQRFDASAASRLLFLADPHADAHTVIAERRPETLLSNLLPVEPPEMFFSAPTTADGYGQVYAAMREAGGPVRADWTLHEGRLISCVDPSETALRGIVSGKPTLVEASTWADAGPLERQYVRLLNRALIQDVSEDCFHHRGRDIIYFKASLDLKHRKILGGTGQSRLVFHPKHNKNTGKVSYYKHAALRWQFLRLDGQWFCVLTPEFHYTYDGYKDSLYYAQYLAGIKRLDRNLAVLGHVRMWGAYLRGTETLLNQDRDPILRFASLVEFATERGINDQDWRVDPRPDVARGDATQPRDSEEMTSMFEELP